MMKKVNKTDYKSNMVLLISDENEIADLPGSLSKTVSTFKNSDEIEQFFKNESQYIFLVKENKDKEKMRIAGANICKQLNKKEDNLTIVGNGEYALALAEGLLLANYQFLKYVKEKKDKEYALKNISIYSDATQDTVDFINNTIKAVYWSRTMVNEPVCQLDAVQLSKEIEKLGKEANFQVNILHKTEIEKLQMGGLLAVNKGSIDPPTFTILEYKPKNPSNEKPIILVGKGVVYDTGGLSLKPTADSMDRMKSDMGGAACMAGTIYAAALNKLDVHLIALIPATDNRPGGNAYTPGDIVTMYDKTTVEVLNTDAEGRIILADAIAYANQYEPELIIDAATLTGAARVVAGDRAACVMGNADERIIEALVKSGSAVHERLVLLPFWDDYKEQLESSVADLKNVGGPNAGTITAGKFLEHFAKYPYIHLDIAAVNFVTAPQGYKPTGGTGTGIRTLIHFLKNYKTV